MEIFAELNKEEWEEILIPLRKERNEMKRNKKLAKKNKIAFIEDVLVNECLVKLYCSKNWFGQFPKLVKPVFKFQHQIEQ